MQKRKTSRKTGRKQAEYGKKHNMQRPKLGKVTGGKSAKNFPWF